MVILAGGRGERLRPLTVSIPKPMAEVGGKPFLEYHIRYLKSFGFRRFVFLTGYLSERIEAYFGNGRKFGVDIAYSVETEPLGTAGSIKAAGKLFRHFPIVVLNGDSFLEVPYPDYLAYHWHKGGLATLCLLRSRDSDRYGSVMENPDGLITDFLEKQSKYKESMINGGVYVLEKAVLDCIPEHRAVSLEHEVFPDLVGKKQIYGFNTAGYFIDIGTPESLETARTELPLHL